MSERQSISGAYAKIESHEDLCAERYERIHETLSDLKGLAKWCAGGMAAMTITLFGFMAHQLYNNLLDASHGAPAAHGSAR